MIAQVSDESALRTDRHGRELNADPAGTLVVVASIQGFHSLIHSKYEYDIHKVCPPYVGGSLTALISDW